MTLLPTYVPDLIRLAVKDFRTTLRSTRYRIAMRTWHDPWERDVCFVCYAGAVMAQSLGADWRLLQEPEDFPGNIRQLSALNLLRIGHLRAAAAMLQQALPAGVPEIVAVPDYDPADPAAFLNNMLAIADRWEAAQPRSRNRKEKRSAEGSLPSEHPRSAEGSLPSEHPGYVEETALIRRLVEPIANEACQAIEAFKLNSQHVRYVRQAALEELIKMLEAKV